MQIIGSLKCIPKIQHIVWDIQQILIILGDSSSICDCVVDGDCMLNQVPIRPYNWPLVAQSTLVIVCLGKIIQNKGR